MKKFYNTGNFFHSPPPPLWYEPAKRRRGDSENYTLLEVDDIILVVRSGSVGSTARHHWRFSAPHSIAKRACAQCAHVSPGAACCNSVEWSAETRSSAHVSLFKSKVRLHWWVLGWDERMTLEKKKGSNFHYPFFLGKWRQYSRFEALRIESLICQKVAFEKNAKN